MKPILTVPHRVNFYNCGQDRTLSLRSYLAWSGDLANRHLEERGITWEKMQQERQVFLLSRLAWRRFAPIPYGTKCRFSTWEYQVRGALFHRNFSLEDGEGRVLAQSATGWIMVDPVERRILRPGTCGYPLWPTQVEVTLQMKRLRLPELPQVAEHLVRPSEIDLNGHLGNQYYADLLLDYAPEPLRGRSIVAAQMTFDHEALEGERISLFARTTGERSCAMYGLLSDGRRCFDAEIEVDG